MRNDALRTVIEKDRLLRRLRAPLGRFIEEGQLGTIQSTGSAVAPCPGCGAPVVQSNEGRAGHAQRMPKCYSAIWGIS